MTKAKTLVSIMARALVVSTSLSHIILRVMGLGLVLVLDLRALVTPLLLFFQTLDSQAHITHEIPS